MVTQTTLSLTLIIFLGVVTFEGQLLLQGAHDNVVIRLLKTHIEDSKPDQYMSKKVSSADKLQAGASKGFSSESLKHACAPCHVCGKKVYAAEYVGANDLPFHKACFRCLECNKMLKANSYGAIDGKFYCTAHYDQMYKSKMF